MTDLYVDQQFVRLGSRIGKGGEGEVYALGSNSTFAAKLYTVSNPRTREPKVAAMIKAGLASRAPTVAFPISIARKRGGEFIGFTMRLVSGHRPLHDLYAPGSRKHNFPLADFRFLVRTAANIARAVATVHRSGCVIGDINHSSILVEKTAKVALIDADSFQFTDGTQQFPCLVGVPEYTPPELQGQRFDHVTRTPNHDAFGLAVVIFQLLFMGRHPFIGTVRRGESPPLHEAIRDYRFVYAEHRDVGMDQPPGTPVLSDFSSDLASAFERAFSRESAGLRPSAEEWITHLVQLEKSLVKCEDNALHYSPRDASECPWCDLERETGAILFLPYVPGARQIPGFDSGAQGFNLERLWAQISAVRCPPLDRVLPRLSVPAPTPSTQARAARRGRYTNSWLRMGSLFIAIVILYLAPTLWIVYVPLAWWGIFGGKSKSAPVAEPFPQRYLAVERRWQSELQDWHRRAGAGDLATLQRTLADAKSEYEKLGGEEARQLQAYNSQRRTRQLQAFLDDFEIRNSRIRGIGPAKQAALASFGIETAADVDISKLLRVPGFGQANSQGLIGWRKGLEARFRYKDQPNDADQHEIARIRSAIGVKAASLRRTLNAGPQNLSSLVTRLNRFTEIDDPILNRTQRERDQLKCDLQYLGIAVPADTPSIAPVPPSSAPAPSPVARTGGGPAVTPTCPRCGSGMVRRVARRGAGAGRSFWGCSRYPQCRGTRNI